jgi:transmembrane sensor
VEKGDSDPVGAGGKPAGEDENPYTAEALDWFVRLQAAEGDPATARAFRAWCDGDPRRAVAFEKVAAVWGAPEFVRAADNIARSTGFSTPAKEPRRSSRTKIAAAVVSGAVLLWGAASLPDMLIWLRADYVTATGELRPIELPDGSRMILNTATAVSLGYGQDKRGVRVLKGEAYFDVVRDPARPFEVDGDYSRVIVTGTAFAVRLEAKADEVVLSRGKVDVVRVDQPAQHADLNPGEAVNVTGSAIAPVRRVDTEAALAWVDGRITFDARPFGEVLPQLQRYYSGRVMILNSGIADVAVSGNYRLDHPAIAIRSLAEAAGATVTVLPGLIILR